MYKKIIYVWVLFNCCLAHTQTVNEVIQKISKQYSLAKPLQYKSTYSLYKDFDSKKIEETYKGIYYKNDLNEIYTKIGDTEILNSKEVYLKISNSEKAVEISNPVPNYNGDFDIKPLLQLCKIEKFVDYKTYWEITLTAKPYSSLSYSKIVVQVTKNYFLQKQVFYYSTAVNFSNDYRKPDPHYPRLEIVNTNFNRNAVNAAVFNTKTYFTTLAKKQIVPAEKLKKYEIIDQRVISK
ncbi:outer membrane lipoprotein-sorting protein [Flavobacterium johnsoniae]|uniref:outer membrane lipoprotein-sorting protein n=1 Tax=Flavobacterium johnsoniae TaxID=986 RepID=UPI0011EE59A6|nr:outer membrane lipoprotein-sorting protein [Flavobacterium johnsoniae]